jgi:hypothetical protein
VVSLDISLILILLVHLPQTKKETSTLPTPSITGSESYLLMELSAQSQGLKEIVTWIEEIQKSENATALPLLGKISTFQTIRSM